MESPTDEALLLSIAHGEEDAFALLYDRHGRLAYSLAYRILGDGRGAEDVVQEAFLNVWRMARSFDPQRGSARTWLLAAVHHRAVDLLRQRRRQTPLEMPSDPDLAATGREDVWKEVANSLDRQAIERAMAQIPKEQREVIELAYFGGYSHSELAKLLQIPLGTVKGRIRVGMEKLRMLLIDREVGP